MNNAPSLFINGIGFATNKEMVLTSNLIGNSSLSLSFSVNGIKHQGFSDCPMLVPEFIGKRLGFLGDLSLHDNYTAIFLPIEVFLDKLNSKEPITKDFEKIILSMNPNLNFMK